MSNDCSEVVKGHPLHRTVADRSIWMLHRRLFNSLKGRITPRVNFFQQAKTKVQVGKWDREGWIDKRGGGGSISLTVVCEELCVTKLCVTKMVGDKVLCVCVFVTSWARLGHSTKNYQLH